jgi:hypothetical protein
VRPFRAGGESRGRIVVVAGYQGVSYRREGTPWRAAAIPRGGRPPRSTPTTVNSARRRRRLLGGSAGPRRASAPCHEETQEMAAGAPGSQRAGRRVRQRAVSPSTPVRRGDRSPGPIPSSEVHGRPPALAPDAGNGCRCRKQRAGRHQASARNGCGAADDADERGVGETAARVRRSHDVVIHARTSTTKRGSGVVLQTQFARGGLADGLAAVSVIGAASTTATQRPRWQGRQRPPSASCPPARSRRRSDHVMVPRERLDERCARCTLASSRPGAGSAAGTDSTFDTPSSNRLIRRRGVRSLDRGVQRVRNRQVQK